MEFKLNGLFLLFLIISLIKNCTSQCNVCGTVSGVACISEDQFYLCQNGVVNPSVIHRCAVGSVCANVAGGCQALPGPPVCQVCNACNAPKTFTCTNINTWAPCVNGAQIAWPNTCPSGWICNPGGTTANPCISSTWSQISRCPIGEQGFSTTTTTTTTTAATTAVPTTWCKSQTAVGNYANPSDTTCKTYIKCYNYNGVLTGQKYTCPGTTLFNPTAKQCQSGYTCV